jgi:hypothetical protein
MKTRRICSTIAIGSILVLAQLLGGCAKKSCEELFKEVEADCCAGRSGCSLTESTFFQQCNEARDKCSSDLSCSGTQQSSTSCAISCSC